MLCSLAFQNPHPDLQRYHIKLTEGTRHMHPNIEIRARVIANVLDDAYRHSLATKHLYLLSLLLGDSMVGLGLSKSIC